jgi:hypothetical protein
MPLPRRAGELVVHVLGSTVGLAGQPTCLDANDPKEAVDPENHQDRYDDVDPPHVDHHFSCTLCTFPVGRGETCWRQGCRQLRLDGWPSIDSGWLPDQAGRILAAQVALNAAYCASVSNVSAGQRANWQVADVPADLYGLDGRDHWPDHHVHTGGARPSPRRVERHVRLGHVRHVGITGPG